MAFLYGAYAHAESAKRVILQDWIKRDHIRDYLKYELCIIFEVVYDFIKEVAEINDAPIKELEYKPFTQ